MKWPDRVVIVDLEATCWDKNQHSAEEMEVIEIGAVLVENQAPAVLREFDSFVRPVRHPILSGFCTELTSIQQAQVDAADTFPAVWQRFLEWAVDPDNLSIASWGSYDDKQLRQDCKYHGIAYPFEDRHINLKQEFGALHSGHKFGVKRALRVIGMKFEGQHHRGIDDAKNIFRIYEWMTTKETGAPSTRYTG